MWPFTPVTNIVLPLVFGFVDISSPFVVPLIVVKILCL